ncbi:MAG: hypothetical protein ABR611_14920 [Chthoniobacterales bacterium]
MNHQGATRRRSVVGLTVAFWFCGALGVSASGILTQVRPPMPQVLIAVLTIASLTAVLSVPIFRAWADDIAIRIVIAIHLTRFVGIYFLILAEQGALSPRFARPAGYGDVLVATIAVAVILIGPPGNGWRRGLYLIWNSLGLVDILLVVGNAARVGLADPQSMQPLLRFPLSLLPTFLVPLIITTHIIIFRRLSR